MGMSAAHNLKEVGPILMVPVFTVVFAQENPFKME
jgi:hypothetical protein